MLQKSTTKKLGHFHEVIRNLGVDHSISSCKSNLKSDMYPKHSTRNPFSHFTVNTISIPGKLRVCVNWFYLVFMFWQKKVFYTFKTIIDTIVNFVIDYTLCMNSYFLMDLDSYPTCFVIDEKFVHLHLL